MGNKYVGNNFSHKFSSQTPEITLLAIWMKTMLFIVLEGREENPVAQWLRHSEEVQILCAVKSVPWLTDTRNGCAASLLETHHRIPFPLFSLLKLFCSFAQILSPYALLFQGTCSADKQALHPGGADTSCPIPVGTLS